MLKLGFEVKKWESKSMSEYTNEELLEYWYRLRFSLIGKSETTMTHHVAQDLQDEIVRRMEA